MKPRIILFLTVGVLIVVGLFLFLRPKSSVENSQANNQLNTGSPSGGIVEVLQISLLPDVVAPNPVTIRKGTKVIFKNEDSVDRWPASDLHPTHEIYSEFDPKQPVSPGSSWEFIFDKTGNWKYHDHLNPSIRGEIIVVEEGVSVSPSVKDITKVFNVIVKDKKIVGDDVFKVTQGDVIEFNITSNETEEFHIHGVDKSIDLVKDQPVNLKFTADLSGRFEIELENSKTEIATLEVTPK